MEIKVKSTKGVEKTFTVPQTQSVSDLKQLVQVEFSIPVSSQKLIFKGRILDDARTLSDYSIKSQDTIILTSTPSSQPSSSNPSVQPPPSQSLPSASFSSPAPSPFTHPIRAPQSEAILPSSHPVHPSPPPTEEQKSFPPPSQRRGTFDFLMGNSNFEQIVKIIREDPRSFEDFITQLKQLNPELYDLINTHKKEFVELVRGREAESDQVQLTKEEFNDVKELMNLGFSAQDSLEAYLGCGKNKELAASLLFSNNH